MFKYFQMLTNRMPILIGLSGILCVAASVLAPSAKTSVTASRVLPEFGSFQASGDPVSPRAPAQQNQNQNQNQNQFGLLLDLRFYKEKNPFEESLSSNVKKNSNPPPFPRYPDKPSCSAICTRRFEYDAVQKPPWNELVL